MTAKKKASARRTQFAIWLTPEGRQRVDRLVALVEKDLPIKMRLNIGDVVLAAIEEAIERREGQK
jgi:hypothetical protein